MTVKAGPQYAHTMAVLQGTRVSKCRHSQTNSVPLLYLENGSPLSTKCIFSFVCNFCPKHCPLRQVFSELRSNCSERRERTARSSVPFGFQSKLNSAADSYRTLQNKTLPVSSQPFATYYIRRDRQTNMTRIRHATV